MSLYHKANPAGRQSDFPLLFGTGHLSICEFYWGLQSIETQHKLDPLNESVWSGGFNGLLHVTFNKIKQSKK